MWNTVVNPDFQISREALAEEQARMAANPKALARPVLVLAGWRSPAITARVVARSLERLTSQHSADFLVLAYPMLASFDSIVERVQRRAAQAFPGAGNNCSAPLDVVAISMGGLVARAAAIDSPAPGLAITRLFTIATPHRGARLARWIRPDHAAGVMRPGSAPLARLDTALGSRRYELVCYAQLRDWWIGTASAAPPGHDPCWTDVQVPIGRALSHFVVNRNPLITIDIARRLRGETPLARRPSSLPCS